MEVLQLLGEVVTDSTKKNLEMRVEAENGATAGKFDLAKRAKEQNLDAIHDTVHEMARDEARHGKAFEGLLFRLIRNIMRLIRLSISGYVGEIRHTLSLFLQVFAPHTVREVKFALFVYF